MTTQTVWVTTPGKLTLFWASEVSLLGLGLGGQDTGPWRPWVGRGRLRGQRVQKGTWPR